MRRLMMRRVWILLMVVAMALAVAAPATGKKPVDKPNPPAAPIAAYVEAGPWWIHEAGDVIVHTVHVQNKTSDTPIDVTVSTDFEVGPVELSVLGGTTEVTQLERLVSPDDVAVEGEITGTVTVSYEIDKPVVIVQEVSTVVSLYPNCDPGIDRGTPVAQEAGICIWHTDLRGAWTISAVAEDKKAQGMTVTLRDHVPGNWCTTDGSGGGVHVRWHPKDKTHGPLTLDVFLPDSDDALDGNEPLGDGVCFGGGAGGATMPIGNPDSFYLWLGSDAMVSIVPTTNAPAPG
jgi:hypothetical protein